MCTNPAPLCTSSAVPGSCDPTCQVGCSCGQRCTVNEAGKFCEPLPVNAVKSVGASCGGDGETVLFDDCSPGSVCLNEATAACGKHCYRFCRTNADCADQARCVMLKEGSTFSYCEPPPANCSPIFGEGGCNRADRPSPAFGCVLAGADRPNDAICDCAGTVEENAVCTYEGECKAGLSCILNDVANMTGLCRRICPLRQEAISKLICGAGRQCVAYANSVRWGTCQ